MRSRGFVLCVCLFGSFVLGRLSSIPNAQADAAQRTVIVSDEKAGTLRFMINGKEAARFTADGLHVRDDIAYGGVITDIGRVNYDAPVKIGP